MWYMHWDIKSRLNFSLVSAFLLVGFVVAVGTYIFRRYSNKPQETAVLQVISPAVQDTWTTGYTYTIKWLSQNVPIDNVISITIRKVSPVVAQTEGQEFDPVVFTGFEDTGSKEWTISSMYPEGSYVLAIHSSPTGSGGQVISAESAQFSIASEKIIGGQKDESGCLIAAGYSWCEAKQKCLRTWEQYCTAAVSTTTVFTCDDKKTITATFYPQDDTYVDLILSDNRSISVSHALSASGARYAKAVESFVFWTKGATAFITENGATTFANCQTAE